MSSAYNKYNFYYQIKTSIDFLCRLKLNFKSFIRLSEILSIKLTKIQ